VPDAKARRTRSFAAVSFTCSRGQLIKVTCFASFGIQNIRSIKSRFETTLLLLEI
jgi:hypothetical protein